MQNLDFANLKHIHRYKYFNQEGQNTKHEDFCIRTQNEKYIKELKSE